MKRWLCAMAFLAAGSIGTQADVIHATWGGGGALTLRDHLQAHFTRRTNIAARVVEVPNTAGAVRSPTASQYNVVDLTYFEAVGLGRTNLVEAFEDSEFPGLANIPAELIVRNRQGKVVGLATHFAYYAIAFNTTLAKASDFGSWNDLGDPRWKGRLAVTRPIYASSYDLTILARANGGDARNITPGLEPLRRIIGNALTTYTSLAHMNTLLARGEVAAVPFYSTRVWHLRKQGQTNIDMVIPREGALMLPYVVMVPKGSANRAQTVAYLNELIDAQAQSRLSAYTGAIPSNSQAVLPKEIEESLGMTRAQFMAKMYVPDWNVIVTSHEDRINQIEQMVAASRR